MGRTQLAMIAMACAGVAFVFSLFGWVSWPAEAVKAFEMMDKSLPNSNAFGERVNGVFPLILSIVAGAGAALVFLGKTKLVPLDGRQILFVGCACFLLAGILVIANPFETGGSDGPDRSFALWLVTIANFAGAAACFLATMKKGGGSKAAAAPAASEGSDA